MIQFFINPANIPPKTFKFFSKGIKIAELVVKCHRKIFLSRSMENKRSNILAQIQYCFLSQ